MTYAYHWRKAIMASFCLHILLIIGAGHIMAGLPSALPSEEVLLEMDLVNSPAEESVSSPAFKESISRTDMSKSPIPENSSVMPAQQTTSPVHEVEPVVTTSELSMTAAGTVDVSSTSNSFTSSDSQKTNSNAASASVAGGGSKSGIAAPSILSKIDPVYPSAARQAGFQGTVLLKIEILANGRPGEISVARSTGYVALDEAAIAAVEKWRFVPAKDRNSGKTVACITTLPVSFRLHG